MPNPLTLSRQTFTKNGSSADVHRKHALSAVFSLILCLLLTACAGLEPEIVASTRISPASCVGDIALNGRFSMRFSHEGNEEAVHGGFLWNQINDHTEVRLLSPLGQTLATIDARPESAVLAQSGRPPRVAAGPDELAAAELGWPLPVSGMQSWLRGCAVDLNGKAYTASQQSDHVTTQDGWRIRYVGWQTDSSGKSRPKRIDLDRTGSPAGDISIRLVIDTWQPLARS